MQLTKESKQNIFSKYGKNEHDSGSAAAQIALFTERIKHLSQHLKEHKHDNSTQRALQKLVGKRKRLLRYYKNKDIESYRKLIADLGIRR